MAVGCDHAALTAKSVVIEELEHNGVTVDDLGTNSPDSVDYPDIALAVAKAVSERRACCGVLLCGTGIGMSIAANKVAGIRAALVHDVTGARMSRLHNDANVLVLGGAMLGERLIRDIVSTWLSTRFEGGRHQRRIDKIALLDSDKSRDA